MCQLALATRYPRHSTLDQRPRALASAHGPGTFGLSLVSRAEPTISSKTRCGLFIVAKAKYKRILGRVYFSCRLPETPMSRAALRGSVLLLLLFFADANERFRLRAPHPLNPLNA